MGSLCFPPPPHTKVTHSSDIIIMKVNAENVINYLVFLLELTDSHRVTTDPCIIYVDEI
jgi:hypothetical protein